MSFPHTPDHPAPAPAPARQSRAKTLLGTGIGNALEWYDWNVYASFAVYFSAQAFDSSDRTSAFLSTMAIFAVGFVARPFGGVVFGWIGDRVGRKHALSLAVLAASIGSLLIAVLPTYGTVGVLASFLLLLARLIQGLAHGGELPSAQTYLAEHAPREHRGFWASSIYVTGTLGLLASLVLGLALSTALTEEQMAAWGWRVPFAIGAVLGLVALWIRRSMEESEVFEASRAEDGTAGPRENVLVGLFVHWRTSLQVVLMTAGLTVVFYIWSVSMASLASQNLGYSAQQAFGASVIGNVVLVLVLPLWGALSDRIGRRTCALIALVGSGICYLPMVSLVEGGQMWQLVVAISVQLGLIAGFLSHAPAMYAEMFPTARRTSGFGIPYAVAIALFGGTAPYLNTAIGDQHLFGIYAIVLILVSSLTILTLRETRGKDLTEPVGPARSAAASSEA
ncbi:MFS transporter [Brachybacterium squillarum]|uniref:MFS transporter n=1 Tax=Brachybacterium squillarum TaxID=661979 RepID=UPI0022237987|nr:MFS transporter [Brachybacterium squillarum]MCW1806191.1 MFS transporter [Brachybacterium squillarum]